MNVNTAARILGLGDLAGDQVVDPVLRSACRHFVDQLELVADGRVILSNPYELSARSELFSGDIEDFQAALTATDQATLLLLSLVSRAFDVKALGRKASRELLDDEMFQLFWAQRRGFSIAEGAPGVPAGLDSVQGWRLTRSEPVLSHLLELVPKAAAIETLSSAFIGSQPGNYSFQMWQVARWSDDWAVVFGVTDAGAEYGYPLPWLLGFCRLDRCERNFVALLREGSARFDGGFYNTYGRVKGNWRLAQAALRIKDDEEVQDWELMNDLTALADNDLASVFNVAKGDRVGVLGRVAAARALAEEAGLDGLSLQELFSKAGTGPSLGGF